MSSVYLSSSTMLIHVSWQDLLTYLITPWCRVLLEKLTGLQLVKKFPAFHGTRKCITAFTSVRHLSLSWASPIQSIHSHPTSWRSILILPTHLRLVLPSGSFPPVSSPRPYTPPLLTHMHHMPSPSHSRFYHPHNIGWAVQIIYLARLFFAFHNFLTATCSCRNQIKHGELFFSCKKIFFVPQCHCFLKWSKRW